MPRKTKKQQSSNTESSGKPARPRDRGEVVYIGAEIEPDIAQAVQAFIKVHGSTKRFIIESSLKQFLTGKGFWPPKAGSNSG